MWKVSSPSVFSNVAQPEIRSMVVLYSMEHLPWMGDFPWVFPGCHVDYQRVSQPSFQRELGLGFVFTNSLFLCACVKICE